mmetsp:Transcript_17637/g.37439  ORF Transcript_17637/g.37439 Transcript_17637/m.37439 type:complete len:647 (-) Transcript_17637:7-1947(-)
MLSVVDRGRVRVLNDRPSQPGAGYVLLWVQQDVRASCNHALELAIEEANRLDLPVLACYGLYERFPDATERAFRFLLEGLRDAAEGFAARGVHLVCRRMPPPEVVVSLASRAACVVVDCGYARICRAWRRQVAERLPELRLVQVESDVVVPVELASRCREPAAATLRPKLHRLLQRFLVPCPHVPLRRRAAELEPPGGPGEDLRDPAALLASLDVDRRVPLTKAFCGGTKQAESRLLAFLPKLRAYGTGKANDPSAPETSLLSSYLHFGHISPVELGLRVREAAEAQATAGGGAKAAEGAATFLEELIVRRELARNFCLYCDVYDSFECLPEWARVSLLKHQGDRREQIYAFEQLERGDTGDPCWNAAQWEMVATGHMHNYMRMYWCKQIITWTEDPRTAFEWAVRLNNRYSLDGRDENGYMGIAWCFGHHDRPFPERPIFGEVRPMTRSGLEGKFNMQRYRRLVQRKCREAIAVEPRLLTLLPHAALGGGTAEGNCGGLLRFLAPPQGAVVPAQLAPAVGQSRSRSPPKAGVGAGVGAVGAHGRDQARGGRGGAQAAGRGTPTVQSVGLHRFFAPRVAAVQPQAASSRPTAAEAAEAAADVQFVPPPAPGGEVAKVKSALLKAEVGGGAPLILAGNEGGNPIMGG